MTMNESRNIEPQAAVPQPPPPKVQTVYSQMSHDQFLAIYKNFQHDLYREGISENEVSDAIKAWKRNSVQGTYGKTEKLYSLFAIENLRYRKPNDIGNALKLYFQTANRIGVPLLYVLKKENGKVSITFGGLTSILNGERDREIRFKEMVSVLPSILPGFLPGATCTPIDDTTVQNFVNQHKDFSHRRIIFGVPGEKKFKEKAPASDQQDGDSTSNAEFGIERVVDSVNDDFMIIGYSEPVSNEKINENQAIFAAALEFFHLLSKYTEQISHSTGTGTNWTVTEGDSLTHTAPGSSETTTYGDNIKISLGKMWNRWLHGGETSRRTVTDNKPGDAHGHNTGRSEGGSTSETDQNSISLEHVNELARQTEALISRQMKRLEKGLASGMWKHSMQIVAKKNMTAERIADILCGYLGGDDVTVAQVRNVKISDDLIPNLPIFDFNIFAEKCTDTALGEDFAGLSTLLTTEELTQASALPLHEVPGIIVEKLTDYGRNIQPLRNDDKVQIGNIIDHEVETAQAVEIDFEQLKRHAFVTGATGAGKSTTMRQLLLNLSLKGIPFLVIEPVKREYRELKKFIPDLEVITLGSEDCNISLNPFSIEKSLGLIPHIDNLKAAFNATMGNYSSMPFILEDMIYRAYEECGWDLSTGKNSLMEKLEPAGIRARTLPIMSNLLPLVTSSIENFFPMQSDYGNSLLGALRARISSMTRGAKGTVLDSLTNAISMDTLLKKSCVIELWPFTDNEEKAFIMALLMIKLYEHRQSIDIENQEVEKKDRPLEHILVVEEAHRLLAKPQQSSEHSSNGRQKAVEFFADILAEIRSYGQGIVVVDQIPSKLIPDVLKNTDVKIAHRLADKEDREVLGSTMNLSPDQMRDVAKLKPGEGIVYFGGLRQAMKIKVPLTNTIDKEKEDRANARKFH